MTVEQIAQVCHEINRAYCSVLGDDSQTSWEDAPEWQRKSAISGVNFHLENPEAGADASHQSWFMEKFKDGWVYGEVKNAETKEHPCMVSFKELPQWQQAKDYLFKQTVHSLKQYIK
jgi:hypothetical protein